MCIIATTYIDREIIVPHPYRRIVKRLINRYFAPRSAANRANAIHKIVLANFATHTDTRREVMRRMMRIELTARIAVQRSVVDVLLPAETGLSVERIDLAADGAVVVRIIEYSAVNVLVMRIDHAATAYRTYAVLINMRMVRIKVIAL